MCFFLFFILESSYFLFLHHKLHKKPLDAPPGRRSDITEESPGGLQNFLLSVSPSEIITQLVCAQRGASLFSSSSQSLNMANNVAEGRGAARSADPASLRVWRSAEERQQAAVAEMDSHLWITPQHPAVEHLGDVIFFFYTSIFSGLFLSLFCVACVALKDW